MVRLKLLFALVSIMAVEGLVNHFHGKFGIVEKAGQPI